MVCTCGYGLGEECPRCSKTRCPLCKKPKPMVTASGYFEGCVCTLSDELADLVKIKEKV